MMTKVLPLAFLSLSLSLAVQDICCILTYRSSTVRSVSPRPSTQKERCLLIDNCKDYDGQLRVWM